MKTSSVVFLFIVCVILFIANMLLCARLDRVEAENDQLKKQISVLVKPNAVKIVKPDEIVYGPDGEPHDIFFSKDNDRESTNGR